MNTEDKTIKASNLASSSKLACYRRNKKQIKIYGGFTLPTEKGRVQEALELAKLWKADAIRNSDGTNLPQTLFGHGFNVYSTICLVRADQEWFKSHKEHISEKYLMSDPVTAVSEKLEIDLLSGYFDRKYKVDLINDPKKYWEVIDRTTGKIVPCSQWIFDGDRERLVIKNATAFHVYTASFLVFQVWDSTSMYNHLVNGWDCPPIVSIDPYHQEARKHLYDYFDNWLEKNDKTTVVRLTTLAYHFVLDSDEEGLDKYRDWLGYADCITPKALDDFAQRFDYRLKPEDFVDEGFYNATYRVPTPQYRDWMSFIQDFVADFGKTLVDKVHAAGKKAALFWGDHWIGVEPYNPSYQELGLDISIAACEDGVALRRLSDCPATHTKEARLYPYFFPDVFNEEGDPIGESLRNWIQIRRAIFRKPIDRIGYGGYLSLAYKYPGFSEHVQDLRHEFSSILENTNKANKPYTSPVKIGVLSAWGKLRSWINNVGPNQKFHVGRADINEITGQNTLECLSGLPVEVSFFSFEDIVKDGIPEDINVILNDGAAGTSWSGGDLWKNATIQAEIREWVAKGGAFLGIDAPSAVQYQGSFFQLKDVLGVEKETGNTVGYSIARAIYPEKHFIIQSNISSVPAVSSMSYVFPQTAKTKVLLADEHGHTSVAVNDYYNGRAAYISGISFSLGNSDLLYRTLLWASQNEDQLKRWYSENVNISCAAYPDAGRYVICNNTADTQTGRIYEGSGEPIEVQLKSYEMKWLNINR